MSFFQTPTKPEKYARGVLKAQTGGPFLPIGPPVCAFFEAEGAGWSIYYNFETNFAKILYKFAVSYTCTRGADAPAAAARGKSGQGRGVQGAPPRHTMCFRGDAREGEKTSARSLRHAPRAPRFPFAHTQTTFSYGIRRAGFARRISLCM